jgi:hypothetical protein
VPLDGEVCLFAEFGELLGGDANIDIDHAMATGAGQMVVVLVSATDAIAVCAIGELDAIEQTSVDQHLNRTIDGSASQAWLALAQLLPEIIHREVAAVLSQFDQALGDDAARARCALTYLIEHSINLVCYHERASLSAGCQPGKSIGMVVFYHTGLERCFPRSWRERKERAASTVLLSLFTHPNE